MYLFSTHQQVVGSNLVLRTTRKPHDIIAVWLFFYPQGLSTGWQYVIDLLERLAQNPSSSGQRKSLYGPRLTFYLYLNRSQRPNIVFLYIWCERFSDLIATWRGPGLDNQHFANYILSTTRLCIPTGKNGA